jgi:hypothetical protein
MRQIVQVFGLGLIAMPYRWMRQIVLLLVLLLIAMPLALLSAQEPSRSVKLPDLRWLPVQTVLDVPTIADREDATDSMTDPFNPINTYTTYSGISNSSTNLGALWGGLGIADAKNIMGVCGPACFGVFNRPGISNTDLAAVLNQSFAAEANALNLLGAIGSGNFNQFAYGNVAIPGGWQNSFSPNALPGSGFGYASGGSLLDSWLGLAVTPQPVYTPLFFNSLFGYTTTPWAPSVVIPVNPVYATCTVPDYSRPTLQSFENYSLNPVMIYRLNSACVEVFENIVFIGGAVIELAFVNETWVFRYATATALEPIINPVYVVPSQFPDPVQFVPTFNQLTEASPQASTHQLTLQQTEANELAAAQTAIQALGESQLAMIYGTPILMELQQEADTYLQQVLYSDALYLYAAQQLVDLSDDVAAAQPGYAARNALDAEVARFSANPTDDAAELSRRYQVRQQRDQVQRQFDREVKAYLVANPHVQATLDDLGNWLSSRADVLKRQPEHLLWNAAWQQRWNEAYIAAAERTELEKEAEIFAERYPDAAKYIALTREVADLIPAFDEVPQVQAAAESLESLRSDSELREQIAGLEADYHATVEQLFQDEVIAAALERYYSSSLALAASQPGYADLAARGEALESARSAHQRHVAAAVAACYQRLGADCDPQVDDAVQRAIRANDLLSLAAEGAAFASEQARFWHNFYRSSDYVDFENNIRNTLLQPLSVIQPELLAAREKLQNGFAQQPLISDLRAQSQAAITALCEPGPTIASLPVGDPTNALCERVAQMRSIAQQLGSNTLGIQRVQHRTFLPMVME